MAPIINTVNQKEQENGAREFRLSAKCPRIGKFNFEKRKFNRMDETVTTESPTATPIWFWTVGVILVLWNLAGLAAFGFIMSMVGNEDALEVAGMNEAQIQLIMETPIWVNVAFGVATIFGLLGCIFIGYPQERSYPYADRFITGRSGTIELCLFPQQQR